MNLFAFLRTLPNVPTFNYFLSLYLYYKGPIKTILRSPKKKSSTERLQPLCTNEIILRITTSLKFMAPNPFSHAQIEVIHILYKVVKSFSCCTCKQSIINRLPVVPSHDLAENLTVVGFEIVYCWVTPIFIWFALNRSAFLDQRYVTKVELFSIRSTWS